jgi:hypothetical protein
MRALAVATIMLLTSCSGSGGFTEGLRIGKKSDSKDQEETNSGGSLGNEKDSDDTADQPVQITGTYLTCVETKATETSALYGCRVANKKDGSTVELNTLASDWTFDYVMTNNVAGSVTVKASQQKNYHVFFDFEAATKAELKTLLSVTKILLDMIYLPGVGPVGSGPAFAGLLSTFIPQSQSESTTGTLGDLDNNVVDSGDTSKPESSTISTQQPSTTPAKPIETVTTPAAIPSPATPSSVTPSTQPATQATPVVQNSITPNTEAPAAPLNPKDPVAFFTLVKTADGSLSLQAYFDQISGLTNPTFTGAKNLSFAGGVPYSDGTAMIMLTTPMAVSVKKGDKTCTGNGTIGAGVISIPLSCK